MYQVPPDIIKYAQEAEQKWGVPASVSLAQWRTESGNGAHSPGNNPFGMKARTGDDKQTLSTGEHLNGKDVVIPQDFRVFPSIEAAFDAHAQLIATAPVYAAAMKVLPDLRKFVQLMGAKYATAQGYAASLLAMIDQSKLNQYNVKKYV